jgi:hypothetical protein
MVVILSPEHKIPSFGCTRFRPFQLHCIVDKRPAQGHRTQEPEGGSGLQLTCLPCRRVAPPVACADAIGSCFLRRVKTSLDKHYLFLFQVSNAAVPLCIIWCRPMSHWILDRKARTRVRYLQMWFEWSFSRADCALRTCVWNDRCHVRYLQMCYLLGLCFHCW